LALAEVIHQSAACSYLSPIPYYVSALSLSLSYICAFFLLLSKNTLQQIPISQPPRNSPGKNGRRLLLLMEKHSPSHAPENSSSHL